MQSYNNDEERQLYDNYINAKYEYISKIRDRKISEICIEYKDYVWDKDHWGYNLLFSKNCNDNNRCKDIKKIYNKLVLLCHPDKCNEEYATTIFKLVHELYINNNLDRMLELYKYYKSHNSFKHYIIENNITKEEQINKWENEIWYIWYYGKDNIKELLKLIFIPHKEYEMRITERLQEIDRLKKENEMLQEKIDALLAIRDG
ncbi:Chaperone protein DnaJ/HSP40 with basic leucine Zipper domain [Orpheovirus IHUMI-LCC2]|uniref:Chaperone protein DnaJ/HSP40 with basic leucine Zipper domain n=1 Tax=Orpheovirus IHUMI-LCC2 TaxID=2023057 RepID=A0A2I2L5Z8_9VIRU|nr:Chaperone protein DnaJ/HSP40 with basic leucine Zipper domain [Orpheovirus IHUMI-LCC2]SNW62963.1 Chaperone protein DnaJ/HSP40 with basic leucine Zipper domain [Orpheovirus IHUMI-LCC2]